MLLPKSVKHADDDKAWGPTFMAYELTLLGGKGGGGGGGNPCPGGRVVCAAIGACGSNPFFGACGTRERASVVGSCTLPGNQAGQLCCCQPL